MSETIKILLLGNSSVGKSSFFLRYTEGKFRSSYNSTIGVDFGTQWDTAGQDRFRTITNSYYRGTDGVILLYDVTDRQSFENIQEWLREIKEHTQTVTVLLVGNKKDLDEQRIVTQANGQAAADALAIPFLQTSAKQGEGVDDAVQSVVRRIIARKIMLNQQKHVSLTKTPQKHKPNCC